MARSMHLGSFVSHTKMKQPSLHRECNGSSSNTRSIVSSVRCLALYIFARAVLLLGQGGSISIYASRGITTVTISNWSGMGRFRKVRTFPTKKPHVFGMKKS